MWKVLVHIELSDVCDTDDIVISLFSAISDDFPFTCHYIRSLRLPDLVMLHCNCRVPSRSLPFTITDPMVVITTAVTGNYCGSLKMNTLNVKVSGRSRYMSWIKYEL